MLPLHSARDLRNADRRVKIFHHLLLVEAREKLPRLLLVARVAADGRQRVGCERDVTLHGEPPRDILDVWIEAAILVNDDDARQLARPFAGRAK